MNSTGETLTFREMIRDVVTYDAGIVVVFTDGSFANIVRVESHPNDLIELHVAIESLQDAFNGFAKELDAIVDANTTDKGEPKSKLAETLTALYKRMDAHTT